MIEGASKDPYLKAGDCLFSPYCSRRLGSLIPVLLGMAFIVFMMIRAIPQIQHR